MTGWRPSECLAMEVQLVHLMGDRANSLNLAVDPFQQLEMLVVGDLLASGFADPRPALSQALRGELDRARIVRSEEVPSDVVTMHSTVRLRDLATEEIDTYTLVYPADAKIADGKLSILAPLGAAILGYRVGVVVRWLGPGGASQLRIEEILFQPQRELRRLKAGDMRASG